MVRQFPVFPRYARWGFVLLGGWLAWVISQRLLRPLEIDEVMYAYLAKHPLLPQPHPPVYMLLLALVHQGLGVPSELLRGIGIVLVGVAGWIVCRIAERLTAGAGWWAAWLLASNSLVVQGALVLDIDNTLLVWWVAMSAWWVLRVKWPLNRRTCIGLGCWWAVGLLIKTTTPLVWPVGVLAVYAWRRQWRRGLRDVVLMSLVGATVFLACWTVYSFSAGVPWNRLFVGRLVAVLSRGLTDVGTSVGREMAERTVRIGLWIGLPMVALWVFASVWAYRWRARLTHPDVWVFATVVGWMLLLGYWLIGGVNWGFAKYHSAMMPLVAVVGAAGAQSLLRQSRLPMAALVVAVGLMAAWQAVVVGDVLYVVGHTMRHALIFAPERLPAVIRTFLLRLGLLGLGVGLLAGWLASRRRAWHMSRRAVVALTLGLSAIGTGLGLLALQASAPYSTIYCYGRPWKTEDASIAATRNFRDRYPHATILVSEPLYLQVTGVGCDAGQPCRYWTGHETPEQLAEMLKDVDFMVVDPDVNPSSLFRHVWPDPRVQAVLNRDFEARPVETATAWVRRSLVRPR